MKMVHEPDVELLSAEDALMDVDKITATIDKQNIETFLDHIPFRFNIHGNLRDRINDFTVLLCRLLAKKEYFWKYPDWESVPSRSGIYLIFADGVCIYAGENKNLNSHLKALANGNIVPNFNRKLSQDRKTEYERRDFIVNKCSFRFIETNGNGNEKEKQNFKHFIISILNPQLND